MTALFINLQVNQWTGGLWVLYCTNFLLVVSLSSVILQKNSSHKLLMVSSNIISAINIFYTFVNFGSCLSPLHLSF